MPRTLPPNCLASAPLPGPADPFAAFAFWSLAVEPAEGFAAPWPLHPSLTLAVGEVPADPFATRHADPEGPPVPPLPSALLAPACSEADVGCVPQVVPRLAFVGTPGAASAVEQVEAFVGSSAEPTPAALPPKAPVAFAIRFARTRESDVETLDRLASAFAAGPEVSGVGADPSGADGFGFEAPAFVGTLAVVPGPVAVVEPRPVVPGAAEFELDAVTGWLDAMVAGPALPGVADAEPPAFEPCVPGSITGCAESAGPSASAWIPAMLSSATTATVWISLLMS